MQLLLTKPTFNNEFNTISISFLICEWKSAFCCWKRVRPSPGHILPLLTGSLYSCARCRRNNKADAPTDRRRTKRSLFSYYLSSVRARLKKYRRKFWEILRVSKWRRGTLSAHPSGNQSIRPPFCVEEFEAKKRARSPPGESAARRKAKTNANMHKRNAKLDLYIAGCAHLQPAHTQRSIPGAILAPPNPSKCCGNSYKHSF